MAEKIKIPAYLRETFYKKNLQIDSLKRLPSEVRENVISGKRPLLVFHGGQAYPARITKEEGNQVLLEFLEKMPEIKVHENLVGVIATPKERYVFQGPVQVVKDRLVGLCLIPPRIEERFEVRSEKMVFLTPVPLGTFESLLAGKFFLLRDTNLSREIQEREEIVRGYVYDLILDETENVEETFEKTLKAPGMGFILKDISAGGAGTYARKILSLEEPLPIYLRGGFEGNAKAFSFGLLGIARNIAVREGKTWVHLMWVKRLSPEIMNFIRETLGA
ncbi:hypothetical protein FVE67_05140 [Thermosulfurimonas marina]|uniref:Uncharacterized protein n=1 Tax=Thermosulfurimonas marina TaxID=2047767 RepID=A0A6H1WSQ9_9BACT|nr:hypothetical protein [Thermosulfurimonas marina]QJA06222.1 hypothetical protein FVE67_05140 [Thermosulfurimonas marina]